LSEQTTIIVYKETRDALKAIGRKGETYDAILVRLIEYHRQGVSTASALMKPLGGDIAEEAEG